MSFEIQHSLYLNQFVSQLNISQKTILEKIDQLNKLRPTRKFRGYGRTIVDYIIEDQPNREIDFCNFTFQNETSKPIKLFYSQDLLDYAIEYPTDKNTVSLGHCPNYVPRGNIQVSVAIKAFSASGVSNSWGHNERNVSILRALREQYSQAWLRLKRRVIVDLKKQLDSESVDEFFAVKKAAKTQAVMNIAITAGSLMSKIENYRANIGNVQNVVDANVLFNEVELLMGKLRYTHMVNVRALNNNPRIPGGKSVKNLKKSTDE